MLELATPLRPPPPAQGDRPLPETVRRFLIESERRVISHCQKLLAAGGLPDEQRRRIERLLEQAAQGLRGLAA